MSYLLDKKIKRNKFFYIIFFIIILFILIYFRAGVFRGFSYVSHTFFRPVLTLGSNVGEKFKGINSFFYSKKTLYLGNEDLKLQLNELQGKLANYNSILDENIKIKEILGRKNENTPMILSGILSRPNQSPYDTLIIDAGEKQGVVAGSLVFAFGDVPVGRVRLVYTNSSKVVLFSNPGEKTEVLISGKDIFMQLVGRGGGNFEMTLLRDFNLPKGSEVVLPGITPHVVAVVETIISDPRDAFQKALLVSPVNIQELKFVEIAL